MGVSPTTACGLLARTPVAVINWGCCLLNDVALRVLWEFASAIFAALGLFRDFNGSKIKQNTGWSDGYGRAQTSSRMHRQDPTPSSRRMTTTPRKKLNTCTTALLTVVKVEKIWCDSKERVETWRTGDILLPSPRARPLANEPKRAAHAATTEISEMALGNFTLSAVTANFGASTMAREYKDHVMRKRFSKISQPLVALESSNEQRVWNQLPNVVGIVFSGRPALGCHDLMCGLVDIVGSSQGNKGCGLRGWSERLA